MTDSIAAIGHMGHTVQGTHAVGVGATSLTSETAGATPYQRRRALCIGTKNTRLLKTRLYTRKQRISRQDRRGACSLTR